MKFMEAERPTSAADGTACGLIQTWSISSCFPLWPQLTSSPGSCRCVLCPVMDLALRTNLSFLERLLYSVTATGKVTSAETFGAGRASTPFQKGKANEQLIVSVS